MKYFKVFYWFGSHMFETIVKAESKEVVEQHFSSYLASDVVIVQTEVVELQQNIPVIPPVIE